MVDTFCMMTGARRMMQTKQKLKKRREKARARERREISLLMTQDPGYMTNFTSSWRQLHASLSRKRHHSAASAARHLGSRKSGLLEHGIQLTAGTKVVGMRAGSSLQDHKRKARKVARKAAEIKDGKKNHGVVRLTIVGITTAGISSQPTETKTVIRKTIGATSGIVAMAPKVDAIRILGAVVNQAGILVSKIGLEMPVGARTTIIHDRADRRGILR